MNRLRQLPRTALRPRSDDGAALCKARCKANCQNRETRQSNAGPHCLWDPDSNDWLAFPKMKMQNLGQHTQRISLCLHETDSVCSYEMPLNPSDDERPKAVYGFGYLLFS